MNRKQGRQADLASSRYQAPSYGAISLPSSSLVTPLFEAPLREHQITLFIKNPRSNFNPQSHRSSQKLGQLGQVPIFIGIFADLKLANLIKFKSHHSVLASRAEDPPHFSCFF